MKTNRVLAAILIVAALLRFIGAKPGHNQYHADEGVSYSGAVSMIKNGAFDPERYDYPALVPAINFAFFKSVFVPISWVNYYATHLGEIADGVIHLPLDPLTKARVFQLEVLGERDFNALFWGRFVTAIFGVGDVFLTYALGRKLFGKRVGLLAAFLLTFSYKHVINSHIGLPDIYNAFFLLLSLCATFRLLEKPSKGNYLLAGIVAGLSVSVKYQVFALIPLVIVHVMHALKHFKIDFAKLFAPKAFVGALCVPLVFLLVNPYFLIKLPEVLEITSWVAIKYGMGTNKLTLYPFSYFYHIDWGPPIFFAVALGLLLGLLKYSKKTLLILSAVIPFFFVMVYYSRGGFYIRNFITTTPVLFLFAAIFLERFTDLLKKILPQKVATGALILLLPAVVWVPAKNSIISTVNYTKPWNYAPMADWLASNLPPDAVVATNPFDGSNLKFLNEQTEVEIAGEYSLPEHQEAGADWVIVDMDWSSTPFYFWMSYGFDEAKLFWEKPLEIMRNTFHGIATEELLRYQVHAVTKAWQSPDTHLYAIKLPLWPEVSMKKIVDYNFEQDDQGWTQSNFYSWADGALVFMPAGTRYASHRSTSPLIRVKPGHLYKITGLLRTQEVLGPRERDGFIRIDFYDTENPDIQKVGMQASVSARVYGTDEWVEKQIIERAPEGAKYMTVSFQVYNTIKTKIYLDGVVITESIDSVENLARDPADVEKSFDMNYLYPNSHGNL